MSGKLFLFILLYFFCLHLSAQETGTIYGTLLDEEGLPMVGATIIITGNTAGIVSNKQGQFSMEIPAKKPVTIAISFISYKTINKQFLLTPDEKLNFKLDMELDAVQLGTVNIENKYKRTQISIMDIDAKELKTIPNISGGVETILKTLPGVVSNNELSSQYSVRGGNYDENLVYVNDFQIYKPQITSGGKQEGLSFVNPDLASGISFSSGGFEARYGDKMSSVLDVTYKKPAKNEASLSMSLLGINGHIATINKKDNLKFLFGVRQKSNQYILNSLDVQGDYKPSFTDMQSLVTYNVSDEVEVEIIGNYSRNKFNFIPGSRTSAFGVVNSVLQLTVYFDGQEIDRYETYMGGISTTYKPNVNTKLKWLASVYRSVENESFDITGEYFLDAIESDLGNEDFGQVKFNLGVGGFQDFARNQFNSLVSNLEHKGSAIRGSHFIRWGAKYQSEFIDDRFNEWERIDSAGYSIPSNGSNVELFSVFKTQNNILSNRYSGYIQDSWSKSDTSNFSITAGVRFNYWDLNKEAIISPRLQFSLKPKWKEDILFKGAIGIYSQSPFYRELRDLYGTVNINVLSQKSLHAVLGSDWNFKAWARPFKFTTEVYYKHLWDLNPYELDNVRIRYFGENISKGYVAGIDFRVAGEFVKGAESWFSLSILKTKENLINDSYIDNDGNTVTPGYIPRPTDQTVTASIFFQDYIPGRENIKMHLNLVFGSGLPFGPVDKQKYNDIFRVPPYRRVDIGFSALLFDKSKKEKKLKAPSKYFKSIWFSLEVFNLLQVNNVSSYLWVKDTQNTVYAVPNFLTSRRLNARLAINF